MEIRNALRIFYRGSILSRKNFQLQEGKLQKQESYRFLRNERIQSSASKSIHISWKSTYVQIYMALVCIFTQLANPPQENAPSFTEQIREIKVTNKPNQRSENKQAIWLVSKPSNKLSHAGDQENWNVQFDCGGQPTSSTLNQSGGRQLTTDLAPFYTIFTYFSM